MVNIIFLHFYRDLCPNFYVLVGTMLGHAGTHASQSMDHVVFLSVNLFDIQHYLVPGLNDQNIMMVMISPG